mgnify:CR=1 FL=1
MIMYVRAASARVLVGPDSKEWDPEVGYKYSLATFEVLHVDTARNNKLIRIETYKVDDKPSFTKFLEYFASSPLPADQIKYIDTLERPTKDIIGGLNSQYGTE